MPNSASDPRDELTEDQRLLVQAIVVELREEMTRQFYDDLGRGVWKTIKAVLVALVLGLALWGAKHGVLPAVAVHKQ